MTHKALTGGIKAALGCSRSVIGHQPIKLAQSRCSKASLRGLEALQPGCRAQKRSKHVEAAKASNNGSDKGQLEEDATNSEVGILQREVAELRGLVAAQGKLVKEQMGIISKLQERYESPWGMQRSAAVNPFEAQRKAGIGDRRHLGKYDARFHSTTWGATPKDFRVLPKRIILVRHAESEGNIDNFAYTYVPDPQVPLTERGIGQGKMAGQRIKDYITEDGDEPMLYFYMSPYKRSLQTFEALASNFTRAQIKGCQEEVQLREQDFGNFQDAEGKQNEKAERLRFGRFFYRFPNGESGADVYDRMTIFEDHMIRDINAGRFSDNTSLVLVTHGLALRVFLMRWFHWSVDQFLDVYNPPNAEPLVMERIDPGSEGALPEGESEAAWIHTKALYRLTEGSRDIIKGCTSEMCHTSCLPTGSSIDMEECGQRGFPPAWNPLGAAVQQMS